MKHPEDLIEAESLRARYELCLEALFEKDHLSQLGRIVKGLIHNVNGPLQNLSMLVEMLSKGQDQLDGLAMSRPQDFTEKWEAVSVRQRQRFQHLIQQITLLADILRDFMILLEIERNRSEVDLNLILEKMAGVFNADLFFKHRVEMELRLEQGLPHVPIHGRDIIPALMHIFQNAIIALEEASEKKLTIECFKESDASIRLVFRDSGRGLDLGRCADDPCELFCSHWPEAASADGSTEKHVGFGLYAVRRLLSPYGVKFWLERCGHETLAILQIPISPRKRAHTE